MEVTVGNIQPLVGSLCGGITEKQWKLLTSGFPDGATKIQLAELVLEIISLVTKTCLSVIRQSKKSKKDFLSSLEDKLLHSLSEALGVGVVDNFSLKRLSSLIQAEVAVNVDSSVSTCLNVVSPSALNTMVSHTSEVFRKFAATLRSLFPPRPRPQREHSTPAENTQDLEEDQEESGTDDASQTSQWSEGTDSLLSDDSVMKKTSEALQGQMRRELKELVLPLLDSNSDYEELKTEASEELQSLADVIASLICVSRRKKCPLNEVRCQIEQFFAKCFSRAWICRLLEQIKRKHLQHAQAANIQTVRFIFDGATSWIKTGRKQSLGKKEALTLTKELSNSIYRLLLPHDLPEGIRRRRPRRNSPVPESHAEMFADIQSKAWIFVVLRNWWIRCQLKTVSQRVRLPVMGTVPQPSALEDPQLQVEMTRFSVEFLAQKIVFHVYLDLMNLPNNKHDITDRLLENVWAEVKGEDLHHNKNTFKNLNKTVHRILCRRLGGPEKVLLLMQSRDPVVEECIIFIVKERLTAPPGRPAAVCSVFSWLCSVFCRCYDR